MLQTVLDDARTSMALVSEKSRGGAGAGGGSASASPFKGGAGIANAGKMVENLQK